MIDDLITARLRLEFLEKPWLGYVGLVTLRASDYIPEGKFYALNPPKVFPDMLPLVVHNPGDRQKLIEQTGAANDDELAAILWWTVLNR